MLEAGCSLKCVFKAVLGDTGPFGPEAGLGFLPLVL
jgi:hypothetical protein